MTILASLARTGARARNAPVSGLRAAAASSAKSYSGPAVDFDHFSSGWNVDTGDYRVPGKYSMQTFNKISPKVGIL